MILEFILKGDMALWAKNSSNIEKISSDIPPRSALIGMLGRISKKFDKEEVNSFFGDDNCKLALCPIHFGHLFVSGENHIHEDALTNCIIKNKQRTIGRLIPDYHLNHDKILYKIYFYHKDKNFTQRLYKNILFKEYAGYRPYLGISDFTGTLINPVLYKNYEKEKKANMLHSIVKNEYVKDIATNIQYMVECLQRYTNAHYYAEQLTYYYYTENTEEKPLMGTFEGDFVKLENQRIIAWM